MDASNRFRKLSLFATACALVAAGATAAQAQFNKRGDLLIADQFNNRVIEITPAGKIVWQFGLGPNDVSAQSIVGTNDAQRVGHLTLMAGTGVPAGLEPLCPSGCVDNRVLLVNE